MDQALSQIYAESICAPVAVPAFLEYARQEATALLVSQRHVLEALAEALEAHGSLSGTEIDIIIADTIQTRLLAQEQTRREAMREMPARAAAFLKLVEEQANTRSSPTIAQAVSEPGKWPSRSS
jgi:hypothetical protein